MSFADPYEELRKRIFELLAREGRAVHTGEIANSLQVTPSQVHTAMHHAYQTGKAHFVSSEGWSLPVACRPESSSDIQGSL